MLDVLDLCECPRSYPHLSYLESYRVNIGKDVIKYSRVTPKLNAFRVDNLQFSALDKLNRHAHKLGD